MTELKIALPVLPQLVDSMHASGYTDRNLAVAGSAFT